MSLRGQYRHLTLRHERHLLDGTRPALEPGEAQFSSFYLPSLPAGEYSLRIDQTVKPPKNDPRHKDSPAQKAPTAERKFEVIAPEWALGAAVDAGVSPGDEGDESAVVLSVFPAPGHTAPSFATLAHMVLRDPQMPWVRRVSEEDPEPGKSVIPWFALLVFTAEELALSEEEDDSYFKPFGAKISDTLGWDTLAGIVRNIKDTAKDEDTGKDKDRLANFIPKANPLDIAAKTKASVIAVPTSLFTKIFVKQGENTCDVTPFRFMSHVRTVATEGMMSAEFAEEDVESGKVGTATFSIVVSHRLGPTNVDVPTPVLAHLVSLQGIDKQSSSKLDGKNHVLMKSLYSWTYTTLPPDSVDIRTSLRHLGSVEEGGLSVLRTDLRDGNSTKNKGYSTNVDISDIITKRQEDGYTLTRHRTVTGEQTAAIYRGPLVPTYVKHPLPNGILIQSNFGTDLEILDPNLGLMDISYASAWNLGKTLALSDRSFTSALARLRTSIPSQALNKARQNVFQQLRTRANNTTSAQTTYMPQAELTSDILDVVTALNSLNDSVHTYGTATSTNRWRRREPLDEIEASDLSSLNSPHIASEMESLTLEFAASSALAVNGKPYNFHAVPVNTDYAKVQEWILNKLQLDGIPAHYLLPDPSHLPLETLRFFHIDANWTEAFIDGALSLANHSVDNPAKDFARTAIKEMLNRHLTTPTKDNYIQQMPVYGCLLRSQLLVQFPDLTIGATFQEKVHFNSNGEPVPETPKAPILVQRKLATDIMLILFDRAPPALTSLTFTLPAHQQTFIAATRFLPPTSGEVENRVEIFHKRIYATGEQNLDPKPPHEERIKPIVESTYKTSDLFDWDARTLKIEAYAKLVHKTLKDNMPTSPMEQYQEEGPKAAVFALQLNEPIYTLVIRTQSSSSSSSDEWQVLGSSPSFEFHPRRRVGAASKSDSAVPVPPLPEPCPARSFPAIKLMSGKHGSEVVDWVDVLPKKKQVVVIRPKPLTLHLSHKNNNNAGNKAPEPTAQPEFTITISPIRNPPADFIPTNRPIPSDLVFGIIIDPRLGKWNYRLMRIEIQVKIGEIDDPDHNTLPPDNNDDEEKDRPLLRSNSQDNAPPPVMLSNLRFNVLRSYDTKLGFLNLTVVPRTSFGVNMETLNEASFLLPMVDIVPWKIPKGRRFQSKVGVTSFMRLVDADKELVFRHDGIVYMGCE
ncbi:hypothetical protein GGS20DRAFT_21873 [Poronia punctata]|nr:hypothetical protein GGS20DRAFT_21873 [Poronia punctata]